MIKKLLDNLTAPEKGKVSDKTMSSNIIACVIGVLLCVVSLTAATWAWFGASITSSTNSVETGYYKVAVEVADVSAPTVALSPTTEGGSAYALSGGEYLVTIKADGNVSTGYCILDLSASSTKKTFYSSQIFTEVSGKSPTSITFTLTLSGDTLVEFAPCWGTHVVEDGVIYLSDGGSYAYDGASSTLTSVP
ncbi:MAG: hypothetical protein J6L83_02335 [Clostridia bacterium]|nr:hypothetical protein [Clostridia bacterium]